MDIFSFTLASDLWLSHGYEMEHGTRVQWEF